MPNRHLTTNGYRLVCKLRSRRERRCSSWRPRCRHCCWSSAHSQPRPSTARLRGARKRPIAGGGVSCGRPALGTSGKSGRATSAAWEGIVGLVSIDPRVDIGHVHLKVSDIDRALAFYRDLLGFEVMQRLGDEAAFLSAGGYHHHIGLNTWESRGGSPPPRGT